jgi:hypothetical protein
MDRRHGHAGLGRDAREQLLTMSAATIDRALRDTKVSATGPRRRKASTAIRRSVPIRTFSDWDNPAPGFVEADLVSHSGPFAKRDSLDEIRSQADCRAARDKQIVEARLRNGVDHPWTAATDVLSAMHPALRAFGRPRNTLSHPRMAGCELADV